MSWEEIPIFSIQIEMYSSNGKIYEVVAVIVLPDWPLVNPKKLRSELGVTVSVILISNI
jgi:hypothetical protein